MSEVNGHLRGKVALGLSLLAWAALGVTYLFGLEVGTTPEYILRLVILISGASSMVVGACGLTSDRSRPWAILGAVLGIIALTVLSARLPWAIPSPL
jgi:hypothetical protein